jgi:hypothetical protein
MTAQQHELAAASLRGNLIARVSVPKRPRERACAHVVPTTIHVASSTPVLQRRAQGGYRPTVCRKPLT